MSHANPAQPPLATSRHAIEEWIYIDCNTFVTKYDNNRPLDTVFKDTHPLIQHLFASFRCFISTITPQSVLSCIPPPEIPSPDPQEFVEVPKEDIERLMYYIRKILFGCIFRHIVPVCVAYMYKQSTDKPDTAYSCRTVTANDAHMTYKTMRSMIEKCIGHLTTHPDAGISKISKAADINMYNLFRSIAYSNALHMLIFIVYGCIFNGTKPLHCVSLDNGHYISNCHMEDASHTIDYMNIDVSCMWCIKAHYSCACYYINYNQHNKGSYLPIYRIVKDRVVRHAYRRLCMPQDGVIPNHTPTAKSVKQIMSYIADNNLARYEAITHVRSLGYSSARDRFVEQVSRFYTALGIPAQNAEEITQFLVHWDVIGDAASDPNNRKNWTMAGVALAMTQTEPSLYATYTPTENPMWEMEEKVYKSTHDAERARIAWNTNAIENKQYNMLFHGEMQPPDHNIHHAFNAIVYDELAQHTGDFMIEMAFHRAAFFFSIFLRIHEISGWTMAYIMTKFCPTLYKFKEAEALVLSSVVFPAAFFTFGLDIFFNECGNRSYDCVRARPTNTGTYMGTKLYPYVFTHYPIAMGNIIQSSTEPYPACIDDVIRVCFVQTYTSICIIIGDLIGDHMNINMNEPNETAEHVGKIMASNALSFMSTHKFPSLDPSFLECGTGRTPLPVFYVERPDGESTITNPENAHKLPKRRLLDPTEVRTLVARELEKLTERKFREATERAMAEYAAQVHRAEGTVEQTMEDIVDLPHLSITDRACTLCDPQVHTICIHEKDMDQADYMNIEYGDITP